MRFIISSGCEHAKRLAVFGLVYKIIGFLLKAVFGGTPTPIHTLIAAMMGGYCAFGTNTKIAMQVHTYAIHYIIMTSYMYVGEHVFTVKSNGWLV